MDQSQIISLSESAMLITIGKSIDPEVHQYLMQLKERIEANPFKGFTETVPAYNSLAVYYNPAEITKTADTIAASVEKRLRGILNTIIPTIKQSNNSAINSIPVCYDEEFGIDLKELSETLQLSIEEIIQLHNSRIYKVYMLGFTPGFAYMGTIDKKMITQRKKQPRLKVEAGSVAIAGNQTGIYPLASPGGWNIIGRTPLQLFDKKKELPFLLKAGDEVKFNPITKEEFNHWAMR